MIVTVLLIRQKEDGTFVTHLRGVVNKPTKDEIELGLVVRNQILLTLEDTLEQTESTLVEHDIKPINP